ncbi:MAG: xanthine dehydrogenase family protein subunit M [Eubacteriales bacterium]|nr:xanthine dehydrogenase family protein subunit M [Eubacteriales bacterium]
MREFSYLAPQTVSEALALLEAHTGEAVLLNGGTDVVVQLRDRLIAPKFVIDIKRIEVFHTLTFTEAEGLFIGACVTMNELAAFAPVKEHYPFLAEAANSVGSAQVRNRATCVGNIANASPLADTATPLLALDALVHAQGPEGRRVIPLKEFFVFVRKTSLKPGEIITGISVPHLAGIKGAFVKISRRAVVDLSTVCLTLADHRGDCRVAVGAVAPTPIRLPKTEAFLCGRGYGEDGAVEQAVNLAHSEISPIDDVRATREYRYDATAAALRRAAQALRLGGKS